MCFLCISSFVFLFVCEFVQLRRPELLIPSFFFSLFSIILNIDDIISFLSVNSMSDILHSFCWWYQSANANANANDVVIFDSLFWPISNWIYPIERLRIQKIHHLMLIYSSCLSFLHSHYTFPAPKQILCVSNSIWFEFTFLSGVVSSNGDFSNLNIAIDESRYVERLEWQWTTQIWDETFFFLGKVELARSINFGPIDGYVSKAEIFWNRDGLVNRNWKKISEIGEFVSSIGSTDRICMK